MSTLETISQNWDRPHVITAEKNSSFVKGGNKFEGKEKAIDLRKKG
jgi:hypothetical protein